MLPVLLALAALDLNPVPQQHQFKHPTGPTSPDSKTLIRRAGSNFRLQNQTRHNKSAPHRVHSRLVNFHGQSIGMLDIASNVNAMCKRGHPTPAAHPVDVSVVAIHGTHKAILSLHNCFDFCYKNQFRHALQPTSEASSCANTCVRTCFHRRVIDTCSKSNTSVQELSQPKLNLQELSQQKPNLGHLFWSTSAIESLSSIVSGAFESFAINPLKHLQFHKTHSFKLTESKNTFNCGHESSCWMCMSCRLETCMFVDKGQHARKSELCWSMLSTLLVLLWLSAPCRCAAPKISLVNELRGTEWRGLIGQHTPAAHSQRLRAEMG